VLKACSDRRANDISRILGFEGWKCWESEGRGSDGEEEQGDESEESKLHIDDSEARGSRHVEDWRPVLKCKAFSTGLLRVQLEVLCGSWLMLAESKEKFVGRQTYRKIAEH
jgi:hypothetical protein